MKRCCCTNFHEIKNLVSWLPGFANVFNPGILMCSYAAPIPLFLKRSLCNSSSLDAATFHQAIILTHQQLGFDLLQCIQDNTHHNQQ